MVLDTVAGLAIAASASAQTIGIGATKAGAVAQNTAVPRSTSGTCDEVFVKIGGKQMYLWRAVDGNGPIDNLFNVHRHLVSRRTLRAFRNQASEEWQTVTTAV